MALPGNPHLPLFSNPSLRPISPFKTRSPLILFGKNHLLSLSQEEALRVSSATAHEGGGSAAETDDGTRLIGQVYTMRFARDKRLDEVRRLLISHMPVTVRVPPQSALRCVCGRVGTVCLSVRVFVCPLPKPRGVYRMTHCTLRAPGDLRASIVWRVENFPMRTHINHTLHNRP